MDPGSTITYTLSATNTGQLPLVGATATDDLTGVTPYADVVLPLPAGLTQAGELLTWAVPTAAVGETATVSFSVVVHADALDADIHNLATPSSPGTCVGPCTTDHTTPPPWTLTKTADPASGTQVDPNSTIDYTLTATNTGVNPLVGATAERRPVRRHAVRRSRDALPPD